MPEKQSGLCTKMTIHVICVFFLGLLIRILLGATFFGSVDCVNFVGSIRDIFTNRVPEHPYFPLINPFLWLSGVLTAATSIPITLAIKLFPILFDAGIGVLIFLTCTQLGEKTAWTRALVYAFSPVPLLITALHTQFDSVSIFFLLLAYYFRDFFRPTWKSHFLFGSFFAVSFLIKPITLFLALFFLTPFPPRGECWKPYWKLQSSSIAGLFSVLALAIPVFTLFGYDFFQLSFTILKYANKGVIIFGLPKLDGFSFLGRYSRLFFCLLLLTLTAPYYFKRVRSMDIILGAYLLCLAFSGLAPQYLFWPVAFLCIRGTALQNITFQAIATLFLVFYYINPFAAMMPYENMATFATLKGWMTTLMPPVDLYGTEEFLPFLKILGNLAIPLTSFLIFLRVLKKMKSLESEPIMSPSRQVRWNHPQLWVLSLGALALLLTYVLVDREKWYALYISGIPEEYARYAVRFEHGRQVGIYESGSPTFNILTFFLVGTVFWSLVQLDFTKHFLKRFANRLK